MEYTLLRVPFFGASNRIWTYMGSLPKDFKSFASADFAILAYLFKFILSYLQRILSPLRLPIPPLGHISHILYNIPYYPWSYMKFFPAGAQKLFFVAAAKKHLCVRRFCRTCMEWENYSKLLQGCQAGFGDRARARPKKSYPQALVAALRRLWKGGA